MEYRCPVCDEIYDHQSLVDAAEYSGLSVVVIWDDFETKGCEALGLPHSRLGLPDRL